MAENMRDPAAAAKARQRGLTVLERQADEEQRIEAEKEEARRPRAAGKRSQSAPRGCGRDKNGGDEARRRGRQRINEAGRLQSDAGALQLQRRSRSLMSKKDYRRTVVVNAVAPAGGAVMSACPKRSDAQFEQGTAAGKNERASPLFASERSDAAKQDEALVRLHEHEARRRTCSRWGVPYIYDLHSVLARAGGRGRSRDEI